MPIIGCAKPVKPTISEEERHHGATAREEISGKEAFVPLCNAFVEVEILTSTKEAKKHFESKISSLSPRVISFRTQRDFRGYHEDSQTGSWIRELNQSWFVQMRFADPTTRTLGQ